MEMLHEHLLSNHTWYREWHDMKGTKMLTWGIFLMVATVYTDTLLFVVGT